MALDKDWLLKIGNTIQMAGAIYMGEGKTYLMYFPEETKEHNEPHVSQWMNLQDWLDFILQTDIMETEIIQNSSEGKLAKIIVRKSQRQIDQVVSWKVFKRDNYRCRYCNEDDVPLSVDHLVRWEEGGPSIPENLLTACKKCNRTRGNLHYEGWLKHPHYKRVSEALPKIIRDANIQIASTLGAIPRLVNARGR